MADAVITDDLIAALGDGGGALDRGDRGPGSELTLLREAGLLTAPLPVEYDGLGWGTSAAGATAICDVLIALGNASLPVARLYEGHVNAIALIARHGSADQRTWLADATGSGAMLGVWGADSERRVTIEDTATGRVLHGTKAFASGLGDLAFAIVTARTGSGLQLVIVAADDPARADHTAWDVDGMVGSRSGRFDCDTLPANDEQCLGGTDALFVEPDFHGGVWRLAACYAGAMARLAILCTDWLKLRGQTADPMMQARLGAVAIEAETATLWARHAALVVEVEGSDVAKAISTSLFAREAIEQAAVRQLAVVERLFGTALHRRSNEAGRVARDLRFYLRQADLDGKLALATACWSGRQMGPE